jgi:UPF0716 protein FxsA
MRLLLLAAFIAVPLIEIAVFIQVGGWLGLWPTLGLILLTAVIGSWQLRAQGMATLESARRQLDEGRLPTRELFDGLCLLFAGALLLTPGFVTDIAGGLLFVPPVRETLRKVFGRYIQTHGETRIYRDGEEVYRGGPGGNQTIDGDFVDLSDPPPAANDRPELPPDKSR